MCINRFDSPGQLYLVDSIVPCRNYQTKIPPRRRKKPPPSTNKDVRYIPLTQGKFTIVDADDYEHLNKCKWSCQKIGNTFYAYRNESYKKIAMHHEIMNAPKGMVVDHIDGNGLNNRKSNLRICTQAQNNQNKRPKRNCSSKYKGVSFHKFSKKWEVQIACNKKREHVGRFDDEIEAALAYDRKAGELFGEFAYLNFKTTDSKDSTD
ncbi:MAG: HNH endonuclease [Planctomycetes bacterium]|nr:HNH endonuclease [Planctomycetota bacterium]